MTKPPTFADLISTPVPLPGGAWLWVGWPTDVRLTRVQFQHFRKFIDLLETSLVEDDPPPAVPPPKVAPQVDLPYESVLGPLRVPKP
jgi:hypothetical protein